MSESVRECTRESLASWDLAERDCVCATVSAGEDTGGDQIGDYIEQVPSRDSARQ